MSKFTKVIVAVVGLSLSMAACAPAMKGSGRKVPNLRLKAERERKAQEKTFVESAVEVKSVTVGETLETGVTKFTVELEKGDVVEKERSQEISLSPKQNKAEAKADGDGSTVSIEAVMSDDGKQVAIVLTQQSKSNEKLVVRSGAIADSSSGEILVKKVSKDAKSSQDLFVELQKELSK